MSISFRWLYSTHDYLGQWCHNNEQIKNVEALFTEFSDAESCHFEHNLNRKDHGEQQV